MSTVVARVRDLPAQRAVSRLFGISPLTSETKVLYRGALGELLVGETLDKLGSAWDVLHAVPTGEADLEIDHLVIGPPGVFTILTENVTGQEVVVDGDSIEIGGQQGEQIRNARMRAQTASAQLSAGVGRQVTALAVIVLVNPRKLQIQTQAAGVVVVSSRNLLRWLGRLDRQLDGPEVALLSDVADTAATWPTSRLAEQDTAELNGDFAALRHRLERAARLRAVWIIAAFVVVGILACATVALAVSRFMLF